MASLLLILRIRFLGELLHHLGSVGLGLLIAFILRHFGLLLILLSLGHLDALQAKGRNFLDRAGPGDWFGSALGQRRCRSDYDLLLPRLLCR